VKIEMVAKSTDKEKTPYGKFAEVYDSLMDLEQFYEGYYQFILEILLKLKLRPGKVLEIGCGTGKLSEIFIRNCCDVEGLDISKAMLAVAKGRGLKVYNQNMVDFKLGKKYGLILCIFDSMNYLQSKSQLKKCFGRVNAHLESNGLFVFDVNSDYKINEFIPKFYKPARYKIGETEVVWSNSHKPNTWIARITLVEKAKGGGYRKFFEKHVEKAYSLKALKGLLAKSGFRIIGVYSDFEFSAVRKDSLKWFFVCRKQV